MKNFFEERPFIEHEFEQAGFDPATGLSAEILYQHLQEFQKNPSDSSRQIACAKAYAYLLDHVQLEINEHTPFSIKINIGVNYSGFASKDIFDKALFRPQRRTVLQELFPEDFARMERGYKVGLGEVWTDFWHTVPNWNFLLEQGFPGILQKALDAKERLLQSGEAQSSQITFLDSVILCYQAILRLLQRIYDYSLQFDVAPFSECIYQLMHRPPETLYEVMQFSVLYLYFEEIGCERGRTLGAIDRLYLPFMHQDMQKGMSLEEVKELFRFFFLHFTATKRFAEQPFTICGSDSTGKDLSNELSLLILDVYDELSIYDPKIHLRYHTNLDDRIFTKAISMIRNGHSSICLINDHAVYRGYEKLGIPVTDAWDYVLLGCYEPVIIGKEEAEIGITWMNMVKCIEFAINGGADILTGAQIGYQSPMVFSDFEAFFDTFLKQVDYCLDFAIDFAQKQGYYSTLVNPSPIYSSSFPECLQQGKDVHEYPLQYNNMSLKCFGLATVVDSLTAIKKYCFDTQKLTLSDMRTALIQDWKGFEEIRQCIIKDPDKYGNHMDLPDQLMLRITEHLEQKYCGMQLDRGGRLRLGLDSITHCIDLGQNTAATPDGRNAKMPVSKNLCASEGRDRNGIISYMQSVLQINSAAFLNSAILDFIMHPTAVEGAKGLSDFKSLIQIFFAQGGFAAQGNIVSSAMLKDAQKNPEKYATLQVRVCGWNEYFVRMTKGKQDHFIRQSDQTIV